MHLIKILLSFILVFIVSVNAGVTQKKFSIPQKNIDTSTIIVETSTNISDTIPSKVSLWTQFVNIQADLRFGLSQRVLAMKNGNLDIIWKFLFICFVYGALHALGPGHGKSIVVGYFMARRGGWRQGLCMGAIITFSHTTSAVLLLFILYAFLKAAVFPTFEISRIEIEKVSYGLVMLTGIFLIIIAIRGIISSHFHHQTSHLNTNANWKEIVSVAAITGIVPCPAVALIVLFCLLNDMITLSLISSLFICLGMALTNMIFGIGSIVLRKGIDKGVAKSGKLANTIYAITTIIGGVIVFTTGLVLMF